MLWEPSQPSSFTSYLIRASGGNFLKVEKCNFHMDGHLTGTDFLTGPGAVLLLFSSSEEEEENQKKSS